MIDVNLTGTWHAARPRCRTYRGRSGGSIVLTSSAAGLQGTPTSRTTWPPSTACPADADLANELAPHCIRVNSIHPTRSTRR